MQLMSLLFFKRLRLALSSYYSSNKTPNSKERETPHHLQDCLTLLVPKLSQQILQVPSLFQI